jgi:hypothetical protein
MSGEEGILREKCSHVDCGREHRVWLPETIGSYDDPRIPSSTSRSNVSLHHWCLRCGCIQNISHDRPKKMGYWINVLSKLAREYHLTDSQRRRLIIKALQSNEFFEDLYGTTGSSQKGVFVKLVQNYSNLDRNTIDSYIF